MATPSDLTDPAFRDAMQAIEALLDNGDYTGASKAAAGAYLMVLDRHPELIAGAATGPHAPLNMSRATAWPPTGGLTMRVEDGKAVPVYAKERFSSSEAFGYFEFMMNLLWGLQKGAFS
jgi:hypothetical protein